MIDLETKEKLLKEIEKSGNVYLSCLKIGIDKATFYRWKKEKDFNKKANEAIKMGRESNCDIAEHALMINVKERKMEAIKYVLSHHSKIYKPKTRKVIIEHSNTNNSEKAISAKKKEDVRIYSTGYTDAMKYFGEGLREEYEEQMPATEESAVERIEDVRNGRIDVKDEKLMEDGRKLYIKTYGDVPENETKPVSQDSSNSNGDKSDEQSVNRIVLDLPEDDDM